MTTLNRILVATDYSPAGHAAIARACQLAVQCHAELRILHVVPDWNLFSRTAAAPGPQLYASLRQYAEAALRQHVEQLWSGSGIRARGDVHQGSATRAILRAAAEFQPRLLVIGARGEHAPAPQAAPTLGGTALKLLLQSTQPLLLVRGAGSPAYRNAMISVADAGPHARRLLQWCACLAPGALCHLVRTYDVPYVERLRLCGVDETAVAAASSEARTAAQHSLTELLQQTEVSLELRLHLLAGDSLRQILLQAASEAVQLLVLGRHDPRPDESVQAQLGSIGLRLAYHAPCDVLVVP